MNIAEYAINHRIISWLFVGLLLLGGGICFFGLGQLEFPEFTVKEAMVITQYPGASPQQVEEEVTLPLEQAIQELEYISHIDSYNSAGRSQISIAMKDRYGKRQLPQIWDELRRKVNDIQSKMPPGVYPSQVIDDYSDVFGMLFNITGEDYSYRDIEDYANFLKRELILIQGVKKISIAGQHQEQVVLEVSREKSAALGGSPIQMISTITNQNVVSNAGRMFVNDRSVRIHTTGEFNHVEDLEQLIISSPGSSQLVRLGDIATISKVYEETPSVIYHSNGKKALSFGISFSSGVNVVDVGEAIRNKLIQLEGRRPIGIDINTVFFAQFIRVNCNCYNCPFVCYGNSLRFINGYSFIINNIRYFHCDENNWY